MVHSTAVSGGAGGDAYMEYTYLFEYGGAAAIRIRVGSSGGGSGAAAQWALAKVVLMSNVVGTQARHQRLSVVLFWAQRMRFVLERGCIWDHVGGV